MNSNLHDKEPEAFEGSSCFFGNGGVFEIVLESKTICDLFDQDQLNYSKKTNIHLKKILLILECLFAECIQTQKNLLDSYIAILVDNVTESKQAISNLKISTNKTTRTFERRIIEILKNCMDVVVKYILLVHYEESERVRRDLEVLGLYLCKLYTFKAKSFRGLTRLKIEFIQKLQTHILPHILHSVLWLFTKENVQHASKSTQLLEPPASLVNMFPSEMRSISRFFVSGLNANKISASSRVFLTNDNSLKTGFFFYSVYTNKGIWLFSLSPEKLNYFQDFLYWRGSWSPLKIFAPIHSENAKECTKNHKCYATILYWEKIASILNCQSHENTYIVTIKTKFSDPHRQNQPICYKIVGPKHMFWLNRLYHHIQNDEKEGNMQLQTTKKTTAAVQHSKRPPPIPKKKPPPLPKSSSPSPP